MAIVLPGDVRVFNFPVNWDDDVQVEYEYLTDIFKSRSGIEQRRLLRETPRKKLNFSVSSFASGDHQRMDIALAAWQGRRFILPDPTNSVLSVATMVANATAIQLGRRPIWLNPGAMVFIEYGDKSELRSVAAVNGFVATFTTSSATVFPTGTRMRLALLGRVSQSVVTRRLSTTVAKTPIVFDVEPVSEPAYPLSVSPLVYLDAELWLKKPNWSGDMEVTMTATVDFVDFKRGPISYYEPERVNTKKLKGTYLARDILEVEDLIRFFGRCKGQRGSFFGPSWQADMQIGINPVWGTPNLVVYNTEIAQYADDLKNHRDVIIWLVSGSYIVRRISSLVLGEGFSTLIFTQALPSMSAGDSVAYISWLHRWRFATDKLTLVFKAEGIAEFDATYQTLESEQ